MPRAVSLARELKRLSSVIDAYAVFGRFDVVAFLQSEGLSELYESVSKATKLEGIMSTETLVEGEASRHSHDYGRGPFSS